MFGRNGTQRRKEEKEDSGAVKSKKNKNDTFHN
jgi:hypothetical protein